MFKRLSAVGGRLFVSDKSRAILTQEIAASNLPEKAIQKLLNNLYEGSFGSRLSQRIIAVLLCLCYCLVALLSVFNNEALKTLETMTLPVMAYLSLYAGKNLPIGKNKEAKEDA